MNDIKDVIHKYKVSTNVFIILLVACIIYSIFLMYKEGYKGQIIFLSDLLGILCTTLLSTIITLHLTNIRLKENQKSLDRQLTYERENQLRYTIYINNYKLMQSTIHILCNIILAVDKAKNQNFTLHKNSNEENKRLALKCINDFMKQLNVFINKDLILLDISNNLGDKINVLRNKSVQLVRFYNNKVVSNDNFCSIQDIDKMNDIIQYLLSDVLDPFVFELKKKLRKVFEKYEIKS